MKPLLLNACGALIATLTLIACDRDDNSQPVAVPPAIPPPVVVEKSPTVIVEQAPEYREVYVEGRPAPALRIEVKPPRPSHETVWIEGRWEHEHDGHGHYWAWHKGHWR